MMCRLLHSISRGLRHKAQANATHSPWAGNSSQQRRRQEENLCNGLCAAPLCNDAQTSENRTSQPLRHSRSSNSLVHFRHWKWDDGWKSFIGDRQWDSFKNRGGSYTSHDGLEWGSALLFSLHICRVLTAAALPDDSSGGKKKILASVADRLPGLLHKPVSHINLLTEEEGNRRKPKVAESQPKAKIPESTPQTALANAVAQLQAATSQSIGQAQNSLGIQRARAGFLEEAASHFIKGSQVGFGKATFNLAVCYEQGRGVAQDLEKAADLYYKATAQGHPLASYNLGVFHLKGKGGVQQDISRALELITTAAAAGVIQANRYLGVHYLENQECRDEKKAATFLQKAVEKQDTDAQYHLGLCYEHGWGVPVNSAKALSLYHKSAQKDHPEALYSVARFHELGLGGLPINRETALQFYKQASNAGHQQASEYLEKLLCDPTSCSTKVSVTDSKNSKIPHSRDYKPPEDNNKAMHTSVSAPSLIHDSKAVHTQTKDSVNQPFSYMNGKFSISYLNLLLPYFSLPSRPLLGSLATGGQSTKVSFQVGDEMVEDEADDVVYGYAENGLHVSTPWLTVS